MGRSGALGAALVAAGVVLSGCASADGEEGPTSTTTSPAAAEESGNPWDLPIEQRPALFDPCAQIPIEAVEGGLGAPVQPVEEFFNHRPDELISCGWESAEAHFTVLSTWKSREEYLSDEMFDLRDESAEVIGREGMRLSKSTDAFNSTCLQLFFTSQGTVWFELGLTNALNEFRGERTADACSVIGRAIEPLVPLIPEGDFQ
ncbi:DUF3558 family protein [Dietzia sp. CH92]|uniref:DUF3558 family protein n=1 Tax=Dietzia sp. CH92 TaxID=3051823 RepID=UPI0028D36DC4|nr:DUF3558 family protein [Dietzia sp. CH92]